MPAAGPGENNPRIGGAWQARARWDAGPYPASSARSTSRGSVDPRANRAPARSWSRPWRGFAHRARGSVILTSLRLAVVLSLVVLSIPAPASAQPPPGIVLIVADDLGIGDLGAYGQTRIRTPRIDRLAREGLRFTSAYAGAPVCAPSRCVLLTGLHGGHCPVDTNVYPNTPLRPDEITIARLLGGAGYRTGIVGKWGLGGELADGTSYALHSTPWRMGFDEGIVVLDQTLAQDHWPEWVWVDGERVPLEGNVDDGRARYAPTVFVDEALAFLDRVARSGAPFFLYVATTLPHREMVAEDERRYALEPWPPVERAFASMVSALDDDVGEIVDRLETLGLADRTLVIVTSDNGPHDADGHRARFFGSSGIHRGGKRDLFEGGIRVPMIARWPARITPGSTADHPVGLVDLVPTFAELAGLGAPDGIDGESFAPLLRGERVRGERGHLVWGCHEGSASDGEAPTQWAIRVGTRVLIERRDGRAELYDLATDPGQRSDLAPARPREVAALRALRAAETNGVREIGAPRLALEGDGLIVDRAAQPPPGSTIFHLRFDGDAAAHGRPISTVRSAALHPASIAAAANGPLFDADTRSPIVPLDGWANGLSARLDASRHQHLAIPPSPALEIGRASVTIEAWLRLASLGTRQWLLLSKPLGRDDAFVDLGVLAQVGDVATLAAHVTVGAESDGAESDGRELAVVFGDPTIDEGPWAVVSALRIDDHEWHRVVVRIDVAASTVTFDVDGARDVVAFEDRGHLVSTGPVLIGAHHDEHGRIDETLDGWIDELRLSEGSLPDARLLDAPRAPDRAPVEALLDLGAVPRGSAPIVRTIAIVNDAPAPARLLEGEVDVRAASDPRLTVEAPGWGGLASGAGRGEIRVTFRADHLGALHGQSILVHGRAVGRGLEAAGSPVRIRIEGAVIRRTPMDAGSERAIELRHRASGCSVSRGGRDGTRGAMLVALATLVALSVRSGSRRASARYRGSRRSAPTPDGRDRPRARRGTSHRGARAASRRRG
jgi:arylsulfatase A